jgi:hypothetical protein
MSPCYKSLRVQNWEPISPNAVLILPDETETLGVSETCTWTERQSMTMLGGRLF